MKIKYKRMMRGEKNIMTISMNRKVKRTSTERKICIHVSDLGMKCSVLRTDANYILISLEHMT